MGETIDDAARLLLRARALLQGELESVYDPSAAKWLSISVPTSKFATEAGKNAVLRAAAVMAAAAVNMLADEIDFWESLDVGSIEDTPETADVQANNEARPEGEAPAQEEKRSNRKRPRKEASEPPPELVQVGEEPPPAPPTKD